MNNENLDVLKYSVSCKAFMEEVLGLTIEDFHEEWIDLFENHKYAGLLAPRGHGKSESLDTPILTPYGWKLMGNIKEGDYVIGFDGKPTKVVGVFPRGVMKLYKVETSDGRSTRCAGDHLWTVQTPSNTKNKLVTKTTEELLQNYRSERFDKRNGKHYVEYRHFIPTVNPIEFEEKNLLIDPYTLGAWLGDGYSGGAGFTTADPEILEYFPHETLKHKAKYQYRIKNLNKKLKDLNLVNNKHIPEQYLFASIEQRIRLLQGLMDTDGNNQIDGHVFEFSNKNKRLIEDVLALIRSLGGTGKLNQRYTSYTGTEKQFKSYRITGKLPDGICPFRLERKEKQWKGSLKTRSPIVNIEEDGYDECQCIMVENNDGLYITKDYLVTHNTSVVGGYITWKIVTNPDIRILIVTINQNKAEDMMSYIKDNLAYNDKLKEIFGDLTTGYWSKSAIRVKNPKGPGFIHKEPTLQVLGVTSSQISSHYDLIVLDDVCDDKNSRTELKRKRQRLWYNSTLIPMLEPVSDNRPDLGGIINLGTTWRSDDFHHFLMDLSEYQFNVYSAIVDEDEKIALWPDRFSYDDLIKLRDEHIGKVAFEMQYQNKVVQTADSPIKSEWVDTAMERWVKYERTQRIPKNLKKYMGVDLSSKGEETDKFSITIIGIDEDNNYYILDNVNADKTMSQQLDLIKAFDEKYNHTIAKIGIESNATQKIITDEWVEKTDLPIEQLKSSWVNDKWSRIQRLSVLFETKRVVMDPELLQLKDQLIEFPRGKYDDAMDSLSFAIQASGVEEHKVDWDRVVGAIRTKKRDPYVRRT